MKYFFEGMMGMGDTIYQRPFLRHYPGAYVRTPWPELYEGLDVCCVRSNTPLRTQQKNERRSEYKFYGVPVGAVRKRIAYGPAELEQGGIITAFRNQFGVSGPLKFDLPTFADFYSGLDYGKKLAVIRPATVRTEWASASRNPNSEYLCLASRLLMDMGFYVVSIADTEPGKEWIVGNEPQAHLKLHVGELSITQLCTLYEHAKAVVTPVGFSVPMAIAYRTPLFIVAGGRGGHNAPHIVTDPEMDLTLTRWAIPDNYCMCTRADHDCDKRISRFTEQLQDWANEIVLR